MYHQVAITSIVAGSVIVSTSAIFPATATLVTIHTLNQRVSFHLVACCIPSVLFCPSSLLVNVLVPSFVYLIVLMFL
jgi:hypothetical protein